MVMLSPPPPALACCVRYQQAAFGFSGLPESEYPNFLPGVADNDIVAAQNFFQLKNSGDAGLSVNQLIFVSSSIDFCVYFD